MKACKLLLAMGTIALIWLEILPQWADMPEMRFAIARREAAGINSKATYYSDNPAAISGLEMIQELVNEQPDLLWSLDSRQPDRE